MRVSFQVIYQILKLGIVILLLVQLQGYWVTNTLAFRSTMALTPAHSNTGNQRRSYTPLLR